MARAESLTAEGAMPSAQLIVESALAFEEAVCDHFQNGIGFSHKKRPVDPRRIGRPRCDTSVSERSRSAASDQFHAFFDLSGV
jgi:hypothetical protein